MGFFMINNDFVFKGHLGKMSKPALKIFIAINARCKDGSCFPSYSCLQKDTALGRGRVAEGIKELVTLGFIEKHRKENSSNTYKLVGDWIKGGSATELVPIRNSDSSDTEPGVVPLRNPNKTKLTKLKNKTNTPLPPKGEHAKKLSKKEELERTANEIFKFWNEQKIIIHKIPEIHLNAIRGKLNSKYTPEEIKAAIGSYKEVLDSPQCNLTHHWTLKEFLTRALDKFLPGSNPKLSYKRFDYGKNNSTGGVEKTNADREPGLRIDEDSPF